MYTALMLRYWKPAAIAGAVLIAFAAGRYSRRPTMTKTETTTSTTTKETAQVVEKKAEEKQETKTIVVYRDVVTHKDGTTETKEETQTKEGSDDRTTDESVAQSVKTAEGSSQTVTITKPADAPRWYAGVSLGVPIGLHPLLGTPFVVADVSYRVLGPFSVGIWASLDIHGSNFAAGPSLGVTF